MSIDMSNGSANSDHNIQKPNVYWARWYKFLQKRFGEEHTLKFSQVHIHLGKMTTKWNFLHLIILSERANKKKVIKLLEFWYVLYKLIIFFCNSYLLVNFH